MYIYTHTHTSTQTRLTADCPFLLPSPCVKVSYDVNPRDGILKMTCHLHAACHPPLQCSSIPLYCQQNIAEDGIKNVGCCFWFPVADGLMNAWLADCSCVESKAITWKNIREKADDNFIYILPFLIILFSTCDLALYLWSWCSPDFFLFFSSESFETESIQL